MRIYGKMKHMRKAFFLFPLFVFFSCAHSSPSKSMAKREANSPLLSTSSRVCRPIGAADRARVLRMADPENFPSTRYRRGGTSKIEKATDCSHFVHEIYRRAGLPYEFRATSALRDAREFEVLPESKAQPGDLMLFRGHVGIVDNNGRIISAVGTRHRGRKSSITAMDRSNFQSVRGRRYVLRYRCSKSLEYTATAEP